MKRIAICMTILGFFSPVMAEGAIQSVIIHLNADTSDVSNAQSYVVPTNKILVIENLHGSDPGEDLIIENTNLNARINYTMAKMEHVDDAGSTVQQGGAFMISFQPSLKIPGGWTLRMHEDVFIGGGDLVIAIFGLLVDAEDLYAGIDSTFDNYALGSGGSLQARIALDVGRQALIKLEESQGLASWTERTDISTALGTTHSEHIITIPGPTNPKAFQRARVRSRRGSGSMPH